MEKRCVFVSLCLTLKDKGVFAIILFTYLYCIIISKYRYGGKTMFCVVKWGGTYRRIFVYVGSLWSKHKINYRKFDGWLGKWKHEKLKETGTLSKNSKYERRMLKIEGGIPFQRSNLQTFVWLGDNFCHPAIQTSANFVNFESSIWNRFPK